MESNARWGEGTGERVIKIFPRWDCELIYTVAGVFQWRYGLLYIHLIFWSVFGLFSIVGVTLFFSECSKQLCQSRINFTYRIGSCLYLGTSFSDQWIVYLHTVTDI